MTQPDDFDRLLDEADLPEAEVVLCLKGSLRTRWEQAERELRRLQAEVAARVKAGADMLTDHGDVEDAAQAVRDAEDAMQAASVTFRLRGLSHVAFNELVLAHPPRPGSRVDEQRGWDASTFLPELVRRAVVEPELTESRWNRLVQTATDRQVDQLFDTAWSLSRGVDGSVPHSRLASVVSRASGETLNSPEPSE